MRSYTQKEAEEKIMKIVIVSEFKDEGVLEEIARALGEIYGAEVELRLRENLIGEEFLNPERGQYDAWRIVQYYRLALSKDEYILLVTDKDLYAANLNFVFGLAWRGVAIISLHRLFPEFYGQPPDHKLLAERAVKEAVHEVGHLHGLTHCSDKRCVMAFSNSILDTDYKSYKLCRKCSAKLRLF